MKDTFTSLCLTVAILGGTANLFAQDEIPKRQFVETKRFSAREATQAVAADHSHFYAISNSVVAKYDQESGERVALWEADDERPLRHLNSAFIRNGKLFCAHSNYPQWPETSSIEVWDTKTMRHIESHSLGIRYEGSLTWIEPLEDGWLAVFANYSKKVNDNPNAKSHHHTQLVKFDHKWRRMAGWAFPKSVLDRFDPHSCSGGCIGPDGSLYCTGHDLGEVYKLHFPSAGSTLRLTETLKAPITGQGIAFYETQLWGIDRAKRQVVVSEHPKSKESTEPFSKNATRSPNAQDNNHNN